MAWKIAHGVTGDEILTSRVGINFPNPDGYSQHLKGPKISIVLCLTDNGKCVFSRMEVGWSSGNKNTTSFIHP